MPWESTLKYQRDFAKCLLLEPGALFSLLSNPIQKDTATGRTGLRLQDVVLVSNHFLFSVPGNLSFICSLGKYIRPSRGQAHLGRREKEGERRRGNSTGSADARL